MQILKYGTYLKKKKALRNTLRMEVGVGRVARLCYWEMEEGGWLEICGKLLHQMWMGGFLTHSGN